MLNPDNNTLEWCAKWIEDSLRSETNERTIEFGTNMAMTIRAVKTNTTPTGEVSAAPVVDRALYSELIHIAAELVRANGFLPTCAEDMKPRLKRADILKTAAAQEQQLKDWAYRVRWVADKLSAAAPTYDDASLTRAALAFAKGQEMTQAELATLKERLAVALRAAS